MEMCIQPGKEKDQVSFSSRSDEFYVILATNLIATRYRLITASVRAKNSRTKVKHQAVADMKKLLWEQVFLYWSKISLDRQRSRITKQDTQEHFTTARGDGRFQWLSFFCYIFMLDFSHELFVVCTSLSCLIAAGLSQKRKIDKSILFL